MLGHFHLDIIQYPSRLNPSAELALCLMLCRLSSPSRYKDRLHLFGRSRSWCSVVFNTVICYLASRYREKLLWDHNRLSLCCLQQYAHAISLAGGPKGIWGFVDGTLKVICRPGQEQRQFYTGYKKAHAIKWQAIKTPDGLISSLAGPFEGRLGDWLVWQQSGLEGILRILFTHLPAEKRLYLYGDAAYSLSFAVLGGYKARVNHELNDAEREYNEQMSKYRIAVEHGFGKVVNLWSFIAFRNGLKIGLSPVAAYYSVAVLLTNIHTCFNSSQTNSQFDLPPPSLAMYLEL